MTTAIQYLAKRVLNTFNGVLFQSNHNAEKAIIGFGQQYRIGNDGHGVLYYTPIIDNIPQWGIIHSIDDQLPIWKHLKIYNDIFDFATPPKSMTTLWLLWKWIWDEIGEFEANTNNVNKSFDKITRNIIAARTELSPELAKYYALMLADVFNPAYIDDWVISSGKVISEWGLPQLIEALQKRFSDVPEFQIAHDNITNLTNLIEKP